MSLQPATVLRNDTREISSPHAVVVIALVGNPNCGKSTLFNLLTGCKAQTGNYARVTTEMASHEVVHKGVTLRLVDLPGLYSLNIDSPEERYARQFIQEGQPDIIVNVLDAGNLERSLFLTTQIIEMGSRRVFALNMIDEARQRGHAINSEAISSMLGGLVVETVGATGEGKTALLDAIVATVRNEIATSRMVITYDSHLESAIVRVQQIIARLHPDMAGAEATRWLAIKLLEGDDDVLRQESDHDHLIEMVRRERYDLTRTHDDDPELMIAHARYGFIHGLVAEARTVTTMRREGTPERRTQPDLTRRIDRIMLDRYFGVLLFLGVLWVMFETTFVLGTYPTGWISSVMTMFTGWVASLIPDGMAHELVVKGVLAGIGGTIVFLPNVVILFFFMAVLSETGYLARTTFLIDRLMHPFGLHGKAFIPMVMGFGCNVPAIMATRTIESLRSRLIAIIVTPFMACSARLPVFILFSGAFFSSWAGTVVFALYLTSIVVAVTSAIVVSRFVVRGGQEPFVMELPPYRLPSLHSVLYHMWENAVEFLHKIGSVILIGSIVLWFLQAFPNEGAWSQTFDDNVTMLKTQPDSPDRNQAIAKQEEARQRVRLENSYLGRAGIAVSPLFAPLGFGWKDTTAILTGLVAKEVVVASYSVLYAQDRDPRSGGLQTALANSMTPVAAVAFMIFALFYCPCIATIGAIRRETKSWRWPIFSVWFSLSVAWFLAYMVTLVGRIFT